MNGVENMLYMQSINANDGTEQLIITFGVDSDVNIDQVNVQTVWPRQNQTCRRTLRNSDSPRESRLGCRCWCLHYSPNKTYDSLFLANYANININDVLYRVPGVGQVLVFGSSDYAMRIWVKPDALAKLGLVVPDEVKAVREQNNVNPSGRVGAEPAPDGMENTYTVRAQGRLQNSQEFAQIVVRANNDGSVVRLKDVARIELGALNYQTSNRMNGQPSAIVAVFQSPGSNALAAADALKQTMEQLKSRFPSDLQAEVVFDTTKPVSEGIKEIVTTLIEAMILVTLVVFLFYKTGEQL